MASILVVFVVIVFYLVLVFCGSRAVLVVESRPSVVEFVKTTETIESLSQEDLLYKNLENYGMNLRGKSEMSMLDEVAAGAAALAEMQSHVGRIPTAVDSMERRDQKMAGYIVKRSAVATGADGGPAGCPKVVDDCENTVFEGKTPGCASDDPMGLTDRRQLTLSELQGDRTEQHLNNDLLQQMTILCTTVQNLGQQMQDGLPTERIRNQEDFATESLRREDDYNKMEKTMTAKMEEGFKSEQQARQQAQSEIMQGLKDEENARQMVPKDLEVLKEEMKSLQRRSGSTVCSEASTGVGLGGFGAFAGPPAYASQFSDIFIPRKDGI